MPTACESSGPSASVVLPKDKDMIEYLHRLAMLHLVAGYLAWGAAWFIAGFAMAKLEKKFGRKGVSNPLNPFIRRKISAPEE